jgi:hypothetical protein
MRCTRRNIAVVLQWTMEVPVNSKKIAVVAVLCAVVALVACRREETVPLKLGGPTTEQPAR